MMTESFRRSPSDPIGQNFGPYKLVRRLGVGGMAETFEAIRRGPSGFAQRVCLKLVLPFFRDSNDFIELFEREARLAAKLRHSNIVGVIDFGQIEGTSYMALELVDGVDLQVLLDAQPGKRLSHDYVALLGHELAAALEHAHSPPPSSDLADSDVNAIIHRDISPSNVLLSRHGEILLTDFGVAKAVTGTSHKQSAVKGKVPYMSPEQLRAESLDGRADLFALGVVLFEALAGRRPYEGAHDPATIMLTLEGDHPPLQQLAPDAPLEICKVIESLIEPDRELRPESAAILTELLDQFVPSPRTRRRLGKMVVESRAEEPASIRPGQAVLEQDATEVHSDSERDETGIRPTPSAAVPVARGVGTAGATPAGVRSDRPSQRRLVLLLTASVLAIGATVGTAVVLWPAGEAPPTTEPRSETTAEEAGASQAPTQEGKPEPTQEGKPEAGSKDDTSAARSGEDAKNDDAPSADESAGQGAKSTGATDTQPAAASARPARLTVVVFPWGNVWINGKPQGPGPLKDESLKPGRYEIGVGQGSPTKTKTVRLRPGQRKTVSFDLTQ